MPPFLIAQSKLDGTIRTYAHASPRLHVPCDLSLSQNPDLEMNRILRPLLLLPILLLVGGCITQNSASKNPNADLKTLKSFYVQRLPADQRGVEKIIAQQLTALGYQATPGDASQPPTPVDALVTYQDGWRWDMTMYMIQLDIQFLDPKSRVTIASGSSLRTSLARKSPEAMADEVLKSIFAAK